MLTDRRFPRVALLIAGLILVSCTSAPEQEPEWTTGSVPSSDGVPIHYQAAGNGPVSLVFVHGWTCDRSYWREQLDHFAATNRVVAVDLAGHGESGQIRTEWTMAAFGEDVAAVVEGLDLEQVVLVGHSMGAPVVVEAAQRTASQTIGLVVVDEFFDLDAPMAMEEVDGLIAQFAEDFKGMTSGFVSTNMFVPESDPALVEWVAEDMSMAPAQLSLEAIRDLFLWENRNPDETLGQVQVPILAIHSDKNPTNVEALDRYGIGLKVMSGVGHFVMMEDPETFNALISEAISDFSG